MKKTIIFLVLLLCAGMTMQAQQRLVLVEEFTSSTCYPACPQLNALLNPWLAANAEKVTVVKYQMNWPGAGDPYYTPEGGTRRGYYGVNGVPTVYVNGVVPPTGTTYQSWRNNIANAVNDAYTQPAQAIIEGYFRVVGNMIYVKTSVTPLISGSNHFIHCAVNEKLTTGNKASNGESEFHHVMMKMFPNGNGTTLDLTEGETITLNFSHDMSTTHVEEMDDLEVAVFVQNRSTRAVLNAKYLTEDNTIPLPPGNVTATQQDETLNINLSWTAISDVSGYNIYRNNVKLNTTPVTEATYQDTVPEYGITYNYAVAAVGDELEGFWATTTALAKVTIPQPTLVTVKQIRGKMMLIEWEMPETEYPVKFKLYRDGASQTPNPITDTFINNTGITYKEYCFAVEPIMNTITGEKSNSVCLTLLDIPQPTNLKAEQITVASKEVLLTWSGSATNTVGYNIYRDGVQINTELITEQAYTDVVPELIVEYLYQVYGVASTGAESEKCGEAKITLSNSICDLDKNAWFTLYPNPVSGILNINTTETIIGCQIFNMQGQLIYATTSNVKEIATDNWASGIYIIRITTEKGTSEKRFNKN